MQAWRVHEFGHFRDVLRWEQAPEPEPPDAGVVIEVRAAGVNFPDLLAMAGTYQVKPPLPFTPGMEAAGVVVRAGPKSEFAPGDRVIASGVGGSFAERMLALDQACLRVPEAMSDADAAAMLITYQTSWFALTVRTQIARGEALLVHGGAGGVGTAAIQIGKALGATVIATAGGEAKLAVCRECGADHALDYRADGFDLAGEVVRVTRGRGADVIYDPVGGDVFDASTRCVAFGGRILVIGFTSGRIPEIKVNRVLLKNIAVIGLHWGAYQFQAPRLIREAHDALCGMYARGEIEPVLYGEYGLADLPEALAAIESRQSFGKIVLRAES